MEEDLTSVFVAFLFLSNANEKANAKVSIFHRFYSERREILPSAAAAAAAS
jgi:hypothetical protein